MSKSPTPETPKSKAKGTSMAIWLLLVLLVGSLTGFGVTSFGSNLSSIGRVGDRPVTAISYARALQQDLAKLSEQFGTPFTLSQATTFGLDQQVLEKVLTQAALDGEAARIGISAGDSVVAAEITAMQAFQGTAGRFERETYRLVLDQNNMTEREYEATLREDIARTILQGAVVGGFSAPAVLTDTIFAWAGENRGFSLLRLTEADLPAPLPTPTDADLAAYHTTNIARFTRAEAKRITYVAALPDDLAPGMAADEVAAKALYDQRIAEFMIPEKRLVERLVYPTDADAAAAKARLDAGETFEALVADRGLALVDIDMGDVSPADLGLAADAVFGLTSPGVVGPFTSDLGPALFRMNAILPAQETTFEQARADLVLQMQTEAAQREIADKVEAVDDLLAGGSTLEEVAAEQGLTLAQIDFIPGEEGAGIAAYPAFRTAAEAVAQGDFPEAVLLDDGGIVALRLDQIVPPQPIPFADARDAVLAAYSAEALAKALADHAVTIKSAVEAGAALDSFGKVETTAKIDRQGAVADAPADVLTAVFDMAAGDLRVIEVDGFTAVLRLDSIAPADTEGDTATALKQAISSNTQAAIAQDAFTLFSNALRSQAGITLDQAAINAVHAQFN